MRNQPKKDKVNLNEVINSPLKRAIIFFFHQNQSCIDTPKGIAAWIASNPAQVEKALEEMGEYNLLVVHRMRSTVGYGYTQEKDLIDAIEEFLQT
jgi:hypothetical protein